MDEKKLYPQFLARLGRACISGRHAAAAAKSLQSCPTLCDPIDGSPPGSSVPGRHKAPHCPAASKLVIRAPQDPLDAGFLTKLTASHGGAEDSLILSIVECVAIPIHWMVEKREVPMVQEYRSERAVLGTPIMHLS